MDRTATYYYDFTGRRMKDAKATFLVFVINIWGDDMRINKSDLPILRNKLLAVYCNETDTNTFIVGKVLAADQDYIMLSLFAPDGSRDGFCLCAWERIFCIETDSRYLIDLGKCLPECQTWY